MTRGSAILMSSLTKDVQFDIIKFYVWLNSVAVYRLEGRGSSESTMEDYQFRAVGVGCVLVALKFHLLT